MRVRGVGLGLANSLEERATDQFHNLPPPPPLSSRDLKTRLGKLQLPCQHTQWPSPCPTLSSVRKMIPGPVPLRRHPPARGGSWEKYILAQLPMVTIIKLNFITCIMVPNLRGLPFLPAARPLAQLMLSQIPDQKKDPLYCSIITSKTCLAPEMRNT